MAPPGVEAVALKPILVCCGGQGTVHVSTVMFLWPGNRCPCLGTVHASTVMLTCLGNCSCGNSDVMNIVNHHDDGYS